jgi:PAS domain S-box-containing protein
MELDRVERDEAVENGQEWARAARQDVVSFAEKIVDTIREPLIILDPALRVVRANASFYETFQVEPGETERVPIYRLGDDQWNVPELRRLLEEVLPNDERFADFRVEHEFAHIGRRVMLLNAQRLDDVQLILLAIKDITDAEGGVRVEGALRESEDRYRAIVEEATDYAIFTTDANDVIETWPPGAQAVFGWTPEEAIGQRVDITFTPEDRAAGQPAREFEETKRTGFALNVRWHQHKDGGRVFIEGSARARRAADGAFLGMLKVGQDKTDTHRVQQALAESEARFRQFADNTADTLWIADAETGCVEYLSPAFQTMFGEPPETVIKDVGRWAELVHPDDRERASQAQPRVRTGQTVSQEYRIIRPDNGAVRWIRDTGFAVRDEQGVVRRLSGLATDVTDAKRAAEHERMLLAELQHRVRNILTVVRSVARRTAETSETAEDYAMHLDGRINSLARTQSVLTRTPGAGVDLEEMVMDELVAHAAEPDRISIGGPRVTLQPKAAETLGLAVHELATNAIKYGALASGGGRVAVNWAPVDVAGERRLRLEWRESAVSIMSTAPRRRGFGTQLIERTVPYDLGATASLKLEPGGARAVFDLPISPRVLALHPESDGGGGDV